jgi:tetratricopeptide (TPR) repeat protein
MAFESLGTYYNERSRYEEAAEQYAAAYDCTGNIRFYRNVIAMYQRSGDFDALTEFVLAHGSVADGYYQIGMGYLAMGEAEAAIPALERVVEVDPDYPDAYLNLGIAYRRAERNEDALAVYDEALKRAEDSETRAIVLTNRANVYLGLERFEEAAHDYQAAISENPGFALAHFNFAYPLMLLGDYDSALEHVNRAAALGHPADEVARLIGIIRERQHDAETPD